MNKWSSGRCAWEKECSRPVTGAALGERQKAQSVSEERKMQKKGCLPVHRPGKNAGGTVKWRAGG